MSRFVRSVIWPAFLAVLVMATCQQQQLADTLLINGKLYTGIEATPVAEALAILGDTIVFVGSTAKARALEGKDTRVVDLKGATGFPGWADAHAQLSAIGRREMSLSLEGLDTKAQVLALVKGRVDRAPAGAWVTGWGWSDWSLPPGEAVTRADLDSIASRHPVLLTSADGQEAIANTRALEIAGVGKDPGQVAGGGVLRSRDGEPTGVLRGDAQRLVAGHVPPPTEAERDSALVIGARMMAERGWTQVHDAGGTWEEVARIRRLYQVGALKLRIHKAVSGPGPDADSLLAAGPSGREFGGRFSVRGIQVILDGDLDSRRAALLEPYADDPCNRGLITADTASLRDLFLRALQRDIQVQIQAAGDRGNRLAFDLVRAAQRAYPKEEKERYLRKRWRIENVGIVDSADQFRFRVLELMPSMQPSSALGDLQIAPARLGPHRLRGAHAWRTYVDLGIPVAGGSGAPVGRGDPVVEFYAAVSRRALPSRSGATSLSHPELAVTREQAVSLFTRFADWAAFQEDVRGQLRPGAWADLTVFDRDLLTIPEAEILGVRAVMTIVAGEVIHSTLEHPPAGRQVRARLAADAARAPDPFAVGCPVGALRARPLDHWMVTHR